MNDKTTKEVQRAYNLVNVQTDLGLDVAKALVFSTHMMLAVSCEPLLDWNEIRRTAIVTAHINTWLLLAERFGTSAEHMAYALKAASDALTPTFIRIRREVNHGEG